MLTVNLRDEVINSWSRKMRGWPITRCKLGCMLAHLWWGIDYVYLLSQDKQTYRRLLEDVKSHISQVLSHYQDHQFFCVLFSALEF